MSLCRVFVVEDEILIRKCVVSMLKELGGLIVGETSSGEKAVEMISHDSPDLVLMDIRLKGSMDGIMAAKEINKHADIPILFMSAYDYRERIKAENIPNILGYLSKPVDDIALRPYIEKARTRS